MQNVPFFLQGWGVPGFFTWLNYLEIHPCFRINSSFLLLLSTAPLYMYVPVCFSCSSVEHFHCFQFETINNETARNIYIQGFLRTCALVSLG